MPKKLLFVAGVVLGIFLLLMIYHVLTFRKENSKQISSIAEVTIHKPPCIGWDKKEGCGTTLKKQVSAMDVPIYERVDALNLIQQLYPNIEDLKTSLKYEKCPHHIPFYPSVKEDKCWWFDDIGGRCGPHSTYVLIPVNGDIYELGFVDEICR